MGQQDRREHATRDIDPRGASHTLLPGKVERGEGIDTIKRGMPAEETAVRQASGAAESGKSPGVSVAQTAEEIDTDTPQEPPEGDVADGSGGLGGL